MTKNDCSKNLKTKLILVLTVMCLLFSCLFGFTACKKSVSVTDPTYSYTEDTDNKDEKIKNGTFSLNADKTADSAFPVTSATGWTKSTDNSSASSAVNSGIVKLTADSWAKTVETLYSDSDFEKYVKNVFPDKKEELEAASDKAEYVAENLFKLPEKHPGDNVDDYAYMLNNIRSESYYELGTAQKLSASSSLSLEKGKTYKISVWVKTRNVKGDGANIRLTNTFGGSSQAGFRISGIKCDSWTQYAIYVKADANYDCSVTLVLGLGYGNGSSSEALNYSEGTVFFDDVVAEEIDSVPAAAPVSVISYGGTDKINATPVDVDGVLSCTYDMNVSFGAPCTVTNLTAADVDFTESNAEKDGAPITSKTYNPASSFSFSQDAGVSTVNVNGASVTVKLTDAPVTVAPRSYYYLSFLIKTELNKFGSEDVNIVTTDNPSYKNPRKTFTAVSDASEWKKVSVLVKNNFESGDRTFDLSLVIGPSDVAAVKYNSEFATGKVLVKDFEFKTGSIDKADYVTADYEDGTDNPEYKLYNSLFNSTATATVALYAGNAADYTEESKDSASYSLKYADGNIGEIEQFPTAVNGYTGVVSEHEMVKENGAVTATNGRTGKTGDGNGNYAGLINSKYLNEYKTLAGLGDISDKLGDYGDDNIQPILIYNAAADSYGFVGTTKNIAASAYAKVSVTLKAVDSAKAYVYLVDVSTKAKTVLQFEDFNASNDTDKIGLEGNAFKGAEHQLMFTVDKNTENTDGWVTVTFYVAAGANAKDFRLEIWNGSRDGEAKSQGYVFVKDVSISTSSAFSEPASWGSAFSTSGNPLFDVKSIYLKELVGYKRTLTSTEEKFNKEYPDKAVSYDPTYVWAKNDVMIYAIYNTLDAVENDPYANINNEDDKSGCAAKTDPSAFWMSFSSILLGVVLILAIVALIVKTARRKRIANRNDAKTQYKVKSRIDSHRENQKRNAKTAKTAKKEIEEEADENVTDDAPVSEQADDAAESAAEQNLDSYVYGEVQDFGDAETNEDKPDDSDNK